MQEYPQRYHIVKYPVVALLGIIIIISSAVPVVIFSGNTGMQRALEIYVPITCTGPDFGFKYLIGTGFTVEPGIVMTAKHVDCGDANITEVSFNHGITWEMLRPDRKFTADNLDIKIYHVQSVHRIRPVKFRQAKLGEQVVGYGVGFDVIGTTGYVIRTDDTGVYTTNTPAGGMSGSAIVAVSDGAVVGLVSSLQATTAGLFNYPTSFVTFGIAADRVRETLELLKNREVISPK